MIRPTKSDPAGRAYLDLQNAARREHRVTSQLMTMYVVERWLARLALSPYADDFVLKGGMLLASLGARRPTADADALARNMAADEATVTARVVEIALIPIPDDGVHFDVSTVQVQQIREESLYGGTRVKMWARISAAKIRLSLDINFGDPVTPRPRLIELPSVRSGTEPVRVLALPDRNVIAEKLSTAVTLGQTKHRQVQALYLIDAAARLQHQRPGDVGDLTERPRRAELGHRTSQPLPGEHPAALEQQLADLRIQLAHRDDELAAARTVNRELMARINRGDT